MLIYCNIMMGYHWKSSLLVAFTIMLKIISSSSGMHSYSAFDTISLESFINRGAYCTTRRHVHLSSGTINASDSITISFSSQEQLECTNKVTYYDGNSNTTSIGQNRLGAILLGTNPQHLDRIVVGAKILRYNTTLTNGEEYISDFLHHITIRELKPNTRYYYQCLVFSFGVESSIYTHEHEFSYNEPIVKTPITLWLHNSSNDDATFQNTISSETQAPKLLNLRRRLPVQEIATTNNHEDRIPSIKPGFLLSDNESDGYRTSPSLDFTFRTAPLSGQEATTTRIVILGDLGVFSHTKECLAAIDNIVDHIDFIMIAGDLSYANGDQRIWDAWFDMMDSYTLLRRKQLFVAAGNHDAEPHIMGDLFTAYEHRFRMPQIAPPILGKASSKNDYDLNLMYKLPYDYGNSYYSFIYGHTHNIVLNSFADFEPNSRQYLWLVNELKNKIDRRVTPWVLVTIHCPIYNTFVFHQNDPQLVNQRHYLEDLFIKYCVNFVLSGHLHGYMRTTPVRNFTKVSRGPIHVIVGNGGRETNAPFLNEQPEEWVAVRDHGTYGFSWIEILNRTTARYEWVHTGRNDDSNAGNVTDNIEVDNWCI